jgi:hypothetical protein
LLFALLALAFRYTWIITYYEEEARVIATNGSEQMCFPDYLIHIVLGFGIIFHTLNAYWMILIVKKVHRKITGKSIGSKSDWEAAAHQRESASGKEEMKKQR